MTRSRTRHCLGGGQIALDVRLGDLPLWLTVAGDYYKDQFPTA